MDTDRPPTIGRRQFAAASVLGLAAGLGLPRSVQAQASQSVESLVSCSPATSERNIMQPTADAVALTLKRHNSYDQRSLLDITDESNVSKLRTIAEAGTSESVVGWEFPDTGPGHQPWRLLASGSSLGSIYEPVLVLGYNSNGPLGRKDPSEPLATFNIEADYNDGRSRAVEMYAEFVSADGSLNVRPFMFKLDRFATNPATLMQTALVVGDPFTIQAPAVTPGEQISTAEFYRGTGRIFGFPDTDSELAINGGVGRRGILKLGRNGSPSHMTIAPEAGTANTAVINLNSRDVLSLYSSPLGAPGAAIAVGANDNSAVAVFDVGVSNVSVKGLVVRGRRSQRANLQEWQDADGRNIAAVTPSGLYRWSQGNQQSTVGTAGAADPPPTRPATYLKIVDGTGQTLLVPAYTQPAQT